jgi:hypothetical protein
MVTDLETGKVAVSVGGDVEAVNGMIAGAGIITIPIKPIIASTKPLAELMRKSLGYFINFKKPSYDTIYQFTIQVKIIIRGFSMMRTDHDFVRLVIQIVDHVNG